MSEIQIVDTVIRWLMLNSTIVLLGLSTVIALCSAITAFCAFIIAEHVSHASRRI